MTRYRKKWDTDLAMLGPCVSISFAWNKYTNLHSRLTNTRMFLFIYNHSHEQTGSLFYGEETCSVSLVRVRLTCFAFTSHSEYCMQWWADVISPGLMQITADGENQLTIAMLVCGLLLGNDKPRHELIVAVDEYGQVSYSFLPRPC